MRKGQQWPHVRREPFYFGSLILNNTDWFEAVFHKSDNLCFRTCKKSSTNKKIYTLSSSVYNPWGQEDMNHIQFHWAILWTYQYANDPRKYTHAKWNAESEQKQDKQSSSVCLPPPFLLPENRCFGWKRKN